MTERYCQICKTYFSGYTSTLEISDGKEKIQITGHDQCVDEIQKQIKSIKDVHKLSVKEVLKQIKF